MKKERIGELLRWYMREHKRWIWLVILLGVIYGSVFYLYNVPVEAAAYGTVLGVTFLLVMNVLWFWKFCRKHRKRMELIPGIEYAYRDMPEADTLAEKDYQQMVMDLGKSCYEHLVELENQEQESKEYYTTCNGRMMYPVKLEQDYIARNLLDAGERLPQEVRGMTYQQLSLFDDVRFGGGVNEKNLCV